MPEARFQAVGSSIRVLGRTRRGTIYAIAIEDKAGGVDIDDLTITVYCGEDIGGDVLLVPVALKDGRFAKPIHFNSYRCYITTTVGEFKVQNVLANGLEWTKVTGAILDENDALNQPGNRDIGDLDLLNPTGYYCTLRDDDNIMLESVNPL
jgi:hypothetical protein